MTDMTHEFSPELPKSLLARPEFPPSQRDLAPELPAGFVTAEQVPVNANWNYAVKSLLLREETSILGGPSNSGKSALVGLLAHAIVAGEPFAGCRTTQGLVIHVAAEAPRSVIDRTRAYADETDRRTQSRYIVHQSAIDLSCNEQVSKFLSDVDAIARAYCEPVALIVVDTLILSIGTQDENSSAAMSLVVEAAKRIARQTGAHVMLVHHTGKTEGRGVRGSSALRAGVDTEILLVAGETDAGEKIVEVHQEKQRSMPKGSPIVFRTEPFVIGFDEDGEERTVAKAVIVDTPAGRAAQGAQRRDDGREGAIATALQMMLRLAAAVGTPDGQTDGSLTFSVMDLAAQLHPSVLAGIKSDDGRRKAIIRVLEKLQGERVFALEKTAGGWQVGPAA